MSSFRLDSASVVVRGRFNPYIFSPQWLEQEKVWEADQYHFVLGSPLDGVQFQDAQAGIEWTVGNQGMTISSLVDAGLIGAKILRLLPHTPVSAVGCNFTFVSDESKDSLVPILGTIDLDRHRDKYPLEVGIWKGVFHVDDVQITMEVVHGDQGVTVQFNHHHPLSTSEEAINALEAFEDSRRRSEDMVSEILHEVIQ